jgi:hypothetical protein
VSGGTNYTDEAERERDRHAQERRIASWRKHGLEERGWATERLIEHQGPASVPSVKLPQPIPTRCTARAYDGTMVTMVGVVTHVRGPWRDFPQSTPAGVSGRPSCTATRANTSIAEVRSRLGYRVTETPGLLHG